MTTNQQPTKRIIEDEDEAIRMLKAKESFKDCRLEGIDFKDHTFDHDVSFSSAELHNVSFDDAKFSGEANFWGAKFSGTAIFWSAKFSGRANFEFAKFSGKAYFVRATFSGKADFIGKDLFSRYHMASFSYVKFEKDGGINIEDAYLGKTVFKSTDLMRIDFTGVKWGRKGWRIWSRPCLYEELLLKGYSKEDRKSESPHVEKLYRQLKQNFEKKGDFGRAGDFHYGELEMKRLSCEGRAERSLYWLYMIFSGYGEHWMQALCILLVSILLLFPSLQLILGLVADNVNIIYDFTGNPMDMFNKQLWKDYSQSLLYTAQVAYIFSGDLKLKPSGGCGILFSALFRIFIPIQVALVTLAIRRKFKR